MLFHFTPPPGGDKGELALARLARSSLGSLALARGTLFEKGREPFPQRTRADVHPRPLRLAAARNPEANLFAQGRRFLLAAAVPLRLAVYRGPPGAEHGKSTFMARPRERRPGRLVC